MIINSSVKSILKLYSSKSTGIVTDRKKLLEIKQKVLFIELNTQVKVKSSEFKITQVKVFFCNLLPELATPKIKQGAKTKTR